VKLIDFSGMTGQVSINSFGYRNPRFFLDGLQSTGSATQTYVIVSVAVADDGVSYIYMYL